MEKMKLVAPWINFYHEVAALFKGDPDIKVQFDQEEYELKLFVDDHRKAEALEYILPQERIFGNVTVKVTVIPNNKPITDISDAIKLAFYQNPRFNFVQSVDTPFGVMNYAVFRPDTVQYYNDDIGDIDGKRTTTIEQVAKEVLTLGDSWHI